MRSINEASYKRDFEKIFIQYFPKVKNFATLLLKSEQEAEDVAQDIFVKLWEQPELWKDNFIRNYLYTMVKNHVLNRIKHKNIETDYINSKINSQTIEEIAEFKDPLDNLYHEELALLLKLSLEQLPEKRRQVFEMSRFQHLGNQEIAEKLDLSVRTVEQHIYLVLKDLKKLFLIAIFLISF